MKPYASSVVIVCCCYFLSCSAQCLKGNLMDNECVQQCKFTDLCNCSTWQNTTDNYDSCSQTCRPPLCFGGEMKCKAERNCTQTCEPGNCEMECDAQLSCKQDAYNQVDNITCSSKLCSQNCHEGNCKHMYCDGENCYQACDEGGCFMNCTESVKFCSQTCTANENCRLECYAEKCEQRCSGPKSCVIINKHNAGFSVVPVKSLAYFMVFVALYDYLLGN